MSFGVVCHPPPPNSRFRKEKRFSGFFFLPPSSPFQSDHERRASLSPLLAHRAGRLLACFLFSLFSAVSCLFPSGIKERIPMASWSTESTRASLPCPKFRRNILFVIFFNLNLPMTAWPLRSSAFEERSFPHSIRTALRLVNRRSMQSISFSHRAEATESMLAVPLCPQIGQEKTL